MIIMNIFILILSLVLTRADMYDDEDVYHCEVEIDELTRR